MMKSTLNVTRDQAVEALQIIISLADAAVTERGGLAAELHLGRPAIEDIVELARAIKANPQQAPDD